MFVARGITMDRGNNMDRGFLRINEAFGKNYCSHENSVKVSKIDSSTFEALEDNVNNPMKFRIADPIGNAHCAHCGHHRRRLLRNDHNGDHIVTLRKKIRSIHNKWEAFNEEESIRLFTAKESGHRTNLDVFLESNGKKLEVTGTYSEGTFKVQDVNELNFNIAEMREAGKVIVNRNINSAFIIALIVIQDALA